MFRRLSIRLYRFLHGEDVADAWPAGAEPVAAPAVQPARTRHRAAHRRVAPHH